MVVQGSVERSNADIKKMLSGWMRENKSTNWWKELKSIQLKKISVRESQEAQAKRMVTRSIYR